MPKVLFEMLRSDSPSAGVFEDIKWWNKLGSLKENYVGIFIFLFVSYGSVKILTSHFPRHIPLQIRQAVS